MVSRQRVASTPTHSTETILLVENEAGVREMTAEALGAAGYRVVRAHRVELARATATDISNRIDLLLTDVMLPDGSGPALSPQRLTARPALRPMFMTGHAADPTRRDRHGHAYEVAEKPFGPQELRQRAQCFLDRAPDGPGASSVPPDR